MKLNCDLGESFGAWTMGQDARIIPLVDMANVACGFHASDPLIMTETVQLALAHKVAIGAHPAYQDLAGFGRRSIHHTPAQIKALLWYQVGALDGICRAVGGQVSYVKPHGALNNDMMKDTGLLLAVMEAMAGFRPDLPLMIPATRQSERHKELADKVGVPLLFEAFADRAYDDDGQLVARSVPGAVLHDHQAVLEQALSFAHKGGVHSISGQWLPLQADSLCVHGDNDVALAAVTAIRQALGRKQTDVQ